MLHSTDGCRATARVQVALAATSTRCPVVHHPDGWFVATFGRTGPMLEDGALRVFEVNAILRHLARTRGALWPRDPAAVAVADQWMDFALTAVRPALPRIAAGELAALAGPLAVLDAALADRAWLAGEPTVADVAFLHLADLPRHGVSLDALARVPGWLARTAALGAATP